VRILIADDDRISRRMLAAALEGWGHEVVEVEDGERAWERIADGEDFSLLVTDWLMPGIDGPELCRRVRAIQGRRYLPIILFTASDRTERLVEGLNAGADAFLTKPLNPPVLLAQIRMGERILELEERLATRLRQLEGANELIRRDLAAAAVVQQSHLPSDPPRLPGFECAWVYEACRTLGGDMFNVFRLDERNVVAYVLDVSGHGTSAALLSVSISRSLVPSPQQGGILKRALPRAPHYEIVPPAEVAAELNRRFQLVEQSGHFCTFLYGVLDLEQRRFRYASAGHPGPIEISDHGARSHDRGGGVPIGVMRDAAYAEEEIALAPGGQILLYTDGVSEAVSPGGEQFGTHRILAALSQARARGEAHGIGEGVQALRKRLAAFCAGAPARDDVTIVGLGVG
jgi:sigma-B regulation protein RsbU (phosphoserine phosphatase)